ncbi:MAG TPA: hypothetical protein VK174_10825 [Chitinophagales bacterium]|nr:hypothetical protein [Chitinophagales bacterium]
MSHSDITGFSGVAILLLAYLLNLIKINDYKKRIYLTMNFVGAGLACLASVMIDYKPFIILEGTWSLVSFVALLGTFKRTE